MKTTLHLRSYLLMILFSLSLFTACDKDDDQEINRSSETESNIVETAQATDALSSLVAALLKADENENSDLVGTLSGNGPFTVFAPTNDAFTALLESLEGFDSLDDFDTDEERAILATILQYHVVAGTAAASTDLSDGQAIATVQGEEVTINLDGGVFIDDATDMDAEVVLPDVNTSNGIVHVINKVLLPQAIIDALNGPGTLVDIVVQTEALSLLEAAVIKADLVDTLNSDGPFTVFAPTDDAFEALLMALGNDYMSLEDFDTAEEIELLKSILLYHVIPAQVLEADLAAGEVGTALTDNSITVIEESGAFVIGDASDTNVNITGTDIMATNGVAHTIDKVLLPQAAIDFVASLQLKNIVEIAIETEDLSVLVEALQAANAGLVETLSGDGPFTVFAPTNEAFIALLDALGDDYNSLSDFDTQEEIDLLVDILTYHVVAGTAAFSTDLSDGQHIATVQGDNVGINIKDGYVHIVDASDENAKVVLPNVKASNGVVHVINKVLLPQSAVDFVASLQLKTIVEIAIETDDLSLLVEALQAANAGLVETLSGDGPFTVFAPTNEAFGALLEVLGDDYNSLSDFDTQEELDLLVDILTYHVVSGTAAFSTDLSDGQHIATVQGDNVGISLKDGHVYIVDASDDNAKVVLPNVGASNGVVHVINKVLLPQSAIDFVASLQLKNIVEIAIETDDLSLLVEALQTANAGLVETLSGDGPFTVFAPTNKAFEDLLGVLGFHSLSDFDTDEEIDILIKVLTYHVVAGTAAFSTDLSNGQQIPTVQGESVGINIKNGTVHVEDATDDNATVVLPNVEASNGVVHVINKVLLPQEVLDILYPPTPNIVELAQSVDDLSLLVDALIQADAGLVDVLSGDGPFTVFAPTNQAFIDLLHALGSQYNSLEDFDTVEEKALLAKILTYHVVAGAAVASGDLYNHQELHTVQGESLFAIINHGVFIRDKTHVDAKVDGPDNEASNGIVHIIDKVLLPQEVLDALH
ncbi:fasciclin domain-containing protein [Flagellimonas sp. W118]|uniref:fasciclin domain-containing protein n=1 Tax=Flagellimonas sp. W118 TaxID=3410791 RepID=UPI003BF4F1F3